MGLLCNARKFFLAIIVILIGILAVSVTVAGFSENLMAKPKSGIENDSYEQVLIPKDLFNQSWMSEIGLQSVQLIDFDPSQPLANNQDYSGTYTSHWLINDSMQPVCTTNSVGGPSSKTVYNAINFGYPAAYTHHGKWIGTNVSVNYISTQTIQYIEPGAKLPVTGKDPKTFYNQNNMPLWIFRIIYAVGCDSQNLRSTTFHAEGVVSLLHAAYYGTQEDINKASNYFKAYGGIIYWTVDTRQ